MIEPYAEGHGHPSEELDRGQSFAHGQRQHDADYGNEVHVRARDGSINVLEREVP